MNKIWIILVVLGFISCQQSGVEEATQQEPAVKEIKSNLSNKDIIRNPVSAEEEIDPDKIAVLKPLEVEYNFGTAKEGEKVEHTFKFVNTGKVPLIIKSATASCGCTVPKKPEEPIAPGEEGEIAVTFNTQGKVGPNNKEITIIANTSPPASKLYLKGIVNKSE